MRNLKLFIIALVLVLISWSCFAATSPKSGPSMSIKSGSSTVKLTSTPKNNSVVNSYNSKAIRMDNNYSVFGTKPSNPPAPKPPQPTVNVYTPPVPPAAQAPLPSYPPKVIKETRIIERTVERNNSLGVGEAIILSNMMNRNTPQPAQVIVTDNVNRVSVPTSQIPVHNNYSNNTQREMFSTSVFFFVVGTLGIMLCIGLMIKLHWKKFK